MILLINCFITEQRNPILNRFRRIDIFKYTLYSYRNIPFSHIYLYILLEDIKEKDELNEYIYSIFKINKENINIVYDRYYKQIQWVPVINNMIQKHGMDELVLLLNNDDHVFIDFNMDILNEGIEVLKIEKNKYKSLYFSHWPEILKLSGKYQTPVRVNNYIKFGLSLLDSIQIFNMELLYYIFITYKWKNDHNRIDSVLNEITPRPSETNPLNQIIYVPLREMFRKFNSYHHITINMNLYCPLNLPNNTFFYNKELLIKKITAPHTSFWTNNNNFIIPQEWININLSLHPENLIYTL